MLFFDAHLDLSLNALEYNRDLRLPVADIRRVESGLDDLSGRAAGTVSLHAMRQGNIGVCVATLIAGCMKPPSPIGTWNSPPQAWAMTRGQLAWYEAMQREGEMRQICNASQLQQHLQDWNQDRAETPIGYILSLEGADSLRDLDDLQANYRAGLRALGPAHYGVGRYALGHDCDGGLTSRGKELLAEMDSLGIILDVTHLSEASFWEALDRYHGPIWASHHNCRALVDHPRQLSDRQIIALAKRDGVIGVAMDMWMVVPNWKRRVTRHADYQAADLSVLADHVDHICQLTGDCRHVGIGSDLDGGFGTEQSPADLDSIADVSKLIGHLRQRGYEEDDLQAIAAGNFLNFLSNALPS